MSIEAKPNLQLEIAHVLFIDIVGYSKLLIDEQRELLQELNEIVRGTEAFRAAEVAGHLIRIPTGDGMALVFSSTPEAPVQCALQISKALKSRPELPVRMGIHSGPVSGITDVNGHTNVAGGGINMAQRVMDCGDAGHILLSKRVAEDLAQYRQWQPLLHELGECKVKHDVTVSAVNLYTDEVGNSSLPAKFVAEKQEQLPSAPTPPARPPQRAKVLGGTIALMVIALTALAWFFLQRNATAPKTASSSSNAPVPGASVAPALPEKSIAVLPFENLSRDPDNAFFTDGVQDEILTDLAKIADLKVISRTSVMQYKSSVQRNLREIGQQLGVAHLLEGSVQRAGGKVRVNAQLIDARTDAHLWAQTYDRDLADVFAIQSEIAKAIADQLQAKLSPAEKAAIEEPPTANLPAYDLYVRAKLIGKIGSPQFDALTRQNMLRAGRLLEQAVERDPAFFLAYCELADVNDRLYFFGSDHTPARLAFADAAVKTALRLRPISGEAHLALATHLYMGFRDYDGARAELEVARHVLPNEPWAFALTGFIDRRQGRWDNHIANLQHALELDPRNIFLLQEFSVSYYALRRYTDMAAVLDRALALTPGNAVVRVGRDSVELESKADSKPLHVTIQTVLAENPQAAGDIAEQWLRLALCERDSSAASRAIAAISQDGITNENTWFPHAWYEAIAARGLGDQAAAGAAFTAARVQVERTVREQPTYAEALCLLGLIDAGLGRKEEAIREGRRAVELLPPAKDALNGVNMMRYLALIYAWAGEKELAIQQLATVTRLPGYLSYGRLKLHPEWDSLRGDPRFEKIVASLAPKETK